MSDPQAVDIGVDIGVRRIALGCPTSGLSYAVDLGKKPGIRYQELYQLAAWVGQVFPIPGLIHLWVEQPYLSNGPGRNQNTTIAMAEVVGAIKAAAEWGQVDLVGQSTWKAQVVGDGRADKEEVALWLKTRHRDLYAKCALDQDQMDAMCIGLYGMMRTSGEIPAPPPKKAKKRKPKEAAVTGFTGVICIMDEISDPA